MKEKAIAISSIIFMLFAASAVLFDRSLFAYAIALIYAVVRWKISEQQGLVVKSDTSKWALRSFVVICCVIFAAGGGSFASVFERASSPLLPGVFAILGFLFAFDIGRYFNKIVAKENVAEVEGEK